MRYVSTRGESPPARLSEALERGIAPDGGLYVPERFPRLAPEAFDGASGMVEVGVRLLEPFFAGDRLAEALPEICREAFDFPVPLRPLGGGTDLLELFHGPTAAFKDFGARFLAAALTRLDAGRGTPLTILVATSGDTGGAVAAAFHGRPGAEVVVLYPKGMVSARQEKQLTCWGGNVRALAVRGDFDACQRLAKAAFADPELRSHRRLSSANSINLGRLLPQMVYYADAALRYRGERETAPGFVVPSGNLGNVAACLWARRTGVPIREAVLATNANPTVTRFLETGAWEAHPTVPTLATAMDVGNPSNMERLVHLFGGWKEAGAALRRGLVDDRQIRATIRAAEARWGIVSDPHTATGLAVRERLEGGDWIVVATAHPAKFEATVEPLVGHPVEVPAALARLLALPGRAMEIEPTLEALRAALEEEGG